MNDSTLTPQPPVSNNPGGNNRKILIICLIVNLILGGALVYFFLLKPQTPATPAETPQPTQSIESLESKISALEQKNKDLESNLTKLEQSQQAASIDTPEKEPVKTLPEEITPTKTISSNIFSVNEVKIGDTIADMKLISLEPVNPEYSALSNDNASAKFSGDTTVSGKWEHYTEEFMMGEMVCFTPDETSNKLLPAITGNERDGRFCFSNDDEAKKEFTPVGGSGTAKILIADFTYFSYPSEGSNTATLVKILEKT